MFRRQSFSARSEIARREVLAFAKAKEGGVAILFGLAFLPLVLMAGVAIDYGRATTMKSRLQTVADAAALAATVGQLRGGDPAKVATNYVAQQFNQSGMTVTTTTTTDPTQGSVTVQISATVPTTMMKIAHVNDVQVGVSATAAVGASGGGGGFTEIAFAFDTTGSMAGTKLTTAQTAASQLVDTVLTLPNGQPNPNVKVALVPFTAYVNVGTTYRNASWLTNTADYTTTGAYGCSTTFPNAICTATQWISQTCTSDGAPYDCSYTACTAYNNGAPVSSCETPTSSYTWYGCVGSAAAPSDETDTVTSAVPVPALFNYGCSSPLIRLTTNGTTIKTAINALTAGGDTYIAPGLLWAWRLLSPNPPFADGQANNVGKKIIVLMTDGANTHSVNPNPAYPDHEAADVAASNAKLQTVCTNVKAAGIQIYAIAFNVTDTTIKSLLSQCATGVTYYFDAQTNTDLLAAYASIGSQLTKLHLIR